MADSPPTQAQPTDDIWSLAPDAAITRLGSTANGLTATQAAAQLVRIGPNTLETRNRGDTVALLAGQFTSPIVIILVFATVVSGVLGDLTDALIILAIITLSGLLGFWQERGATQAVQALLAVVQVKSEVVRDGAVGRRSPLVDVVPGDVAILNAGDVIPGDCLVLESQSLLVDEAALTGETYPVEKSAGTIGADQPIAQRSNALFLGTHVVSGTGRALVVSTGRATQFGQRLVAARGATRADRLPARHDPVRPAARAHRCRARRRHLRGQRHPRRGR